MDILEGEILEGKLKRKGRLRLEYFPQIMENMWDFGEVKELASDRFEWRLVVASNHS